MQAASTCSPSPFSIAFPGLIGRSAQLCATLDRAARVAPTQLPVLVMGESGTGKELIARGLHALGANPEGPFITVNCGALPRELVESELFGHERGAFTGAASQRAGWFERASGGTLVLDEIGEMPLDLQPKLLRVLESGVFFRVGGREEIHARTRVVAMTNRKLRRAALRGDFRLDLYHRLSGMELRLPPLRNRLEDVPLLVDHFVDEWMAESGVDQECATVQDRAIDLLLAYEYPGNVRELRNMVRRALCLYGLPLSSDGIAAEISASWVEHNTPAGGWKIRAADAEMPNDQNLQKKKETTLPPSDIVNLRGKQWRDIESEIFRYALSETSGNRRGAARLLGMSRSTFNDRVKRMGLIGRA